MIHKRLRQLVVRAWICADCGESHDRDGNAARNILARAKVLAPVRGNESPASPVPSSSAPGARETGTKTTRTTA
ncbi:zinc ribbon domain-containing protein [Nitrococcus mobilis]|uniref:zinc ribbon domain-containing protein n=1 Tax=Nitrococcus mobilis TaxID=35797 RepID=UPI0009FD6784